MLWSAVVLTFPRFMHDSLCAHRSAHSPWAMLILSAATPVANAWVLSAHVRTIVSKRRNPFTLDVHADICALACSLGDMGPLTHRSTYRVGTAIDPLRGSTFHQRAERLLIQTHRDGHSRPLPDGRTARTRGRHLGQVIAALSLISPRLNLLITDGISMKKTLTHSEYRIRNSRPALLILHNGDPTRKTPFPHTRGAAHENSCAAPQHLDQEGSPAS